VLIAFNSLFLKRRRQQGVFRDEGEYSIIISIRPQMSQLAYAGIFTNELLGT